jgi:hypothetical protein
MARRRNFPITFNFRGSLSHSDMLKALSQYHNRDYSTIIRQLIEREYHATFPKQSKRPSHEKR